MAKITHPLVDALRDIWEYNPRTGEFLWKVRIVDAALCYKRAAIEAWGEFALVPTDSEIEALGEQLERVKDG